MFNSSNMYWVASATREMWLLCDVVVVDVVEFRLL